MLIEQFEHFQIRLWTFNSWPHRTAFNVWDLAYCGFYFHASGRNSDLLRCVFCGLLKANWTVGDSPWLVHAALSPECLNFLAKKGLDYLYGVYNANPYLLRQQGLRGLPLVHSVSRGVVCDGLDGLVDRGLRISPFRYIYQLNDGTKYYPPTDPTFRNYHDRLRSFHGLRNFNNIESVEELARSGQVYHGPGPLTFCYYCGEEFIWSNEVVEPWEKHARKRQNCFHIHFYKGERFLETVLRGVPERGGLHIP